MEVLMMKNITNVNEIEVNVDNFKELQVFLPTGIIKLDTRGLNLVEGYGRYEKNRLEKIIRRFFQKSGILKFSNGEKTVKLDLTAQTRLPRIIYN